MFFWWFFSQVEVYEMFPQIEGTVWQWKEELFCKSDLKESSYIGDVCVVETSCEAGPLEAPWNQPKSHAGLVRA